MNTFLLLIVFIGGIAFTYAMGVMISNGGFYPFNRMSREIEHGRIEPQIIDIMTEPEQAISKFNLN